MKWTCSVCGYTVEGDNPPEKCPQCGAPAGIISVIEEARIRSAESPGEHILAANIEDRKSVV